jgi:RecA-family ATPase
LTSSRKNSTIAEKRPILCCRAERAKAITSQCRRITSEQWRGLEPVKQHWLAFYRIPAGDLTLYSGNGGSGKTETIIQLLIAVAATLGDWLGCVIEPGVAGFLSCEEPENNVRDRVERICKHRDIDPYALPDLHLFFPDLESTWLISVDKAGKVQKTALFDQIEKWIKEAKPRLFAIDSAAAIYDADAISRRQVREALAMLRKLARETETAIVLLDHPSVRGMADGSGTANSVDWRNSVRSMLHLSDPPADDPDARTLELKKSNYGRVGEKVQLRWNGLTFTTESQAAVSPYRAQAEQEIDDLFLRLLDKRNAQGRPLRPHTGRGSAPAELADDPDAGGVKASAFKAAMERLLAKDIIKVVTVGPPSRASKHLERVHS